MKNLLVNSESKIKVNKRLVHKLVSLLKSECGFDLNQLQIIFVSEEYIHEVNKQFLTHDYSTDIITFGYSENRKQIEGEIYISVDDAAMNARKYKVETNNEIIRLIIHGILHLLGFDDMNKEDKKVMKREENRLVKLFSNFDKQKIIA